MDEVCKYDSIEEFNMLLIKHNVNIILELSIWAETYSYILTLSMTTKLPIIYLKKPFNSVIEHRLSLYKNSYAFRNLTQLYMLINNHKQNLLNTIEPIIYYNKFWNDYFITNTEKIVISKNITFKNNIKKIIMT